MLEKNDIMLMNSIIHKIYNTDGFNEMRKSVLESLRFLIPFETGGFFLASSETPYKLTEPIGLNVSEEELNRYLKIYQELDYTRWTFAAPSSKAYRESDLLQDDVRLNLPYYRQMFTPLDVHYSMLLTIIHKGVFLGVINLFRKKEDGDFTEKEVFLFELLGSHLNQRLYRALSPAEQKSQKYPSKKELIESYHLTLREAEITYMMLTGIAREMICEELCISPNTLKKHIVNIYKKLNISSSLELLHLIK